MEACCSYCSLKTPHLFRCAQCKKALYCCHDHQKQHWKIHRLTCRKPTPRQQPHRPPPTYINSYDFSNEYEIAPSPMNPLAGIEDELKKNQLRQMDSAKKLVEKLKSQGYYVIDNFLGEAKGAKVLWDVKRILRSGIMKDGELVPTNSPVAHRKAIRGDKIAWITGQEEHYENMKIIMLEVDRLIRYCRNGLGNEYTLKGRTPAMVACYPGDGTGYKRHIDNTQKDGRCITCLYYLNKSWDSEANGGQLRVYPTLCNNNPVDIDPIFDRLFIFWSDKRTPHEVLPAYAERFAVTLWYFDAEEREKFKEEYLESLRTSFRESSVQNSSSDDSVSSLDKK